MLGHAEFLAMRRFTALDGLRAIAVILVIDNHVPGTAFPIDGALGVTVFFVLSGFLITTLALREEGASGGLSLKAFYVRRTMRIFPAYYATLALYCLIVFGLNADFALQERARLLEALPYYLTYLNEFHLNAKAAAGLAHPVFGQSWSLAIEEKFYLVWPFLGFVLLRAKPGPRLLVAVALAVFFYAMSGRTLWGLVSYGHILVGCCLAIVMHQERGYRVMSTLARPGIRDAVIVGWLVLQFAPGLAELRQTAVYSLVVAAVVVVVTVAESRWKRLLSTRIAAFIGARSYGMYLLHVLVMSALGLALGSLPRAIYPWVAYPLCVVASALAAHVMYVVLESPAIAKGHQWSARIKAGQAR